MSVVAEDMVIVGALVPRLITSPAPLLKVTELPLEITVTLNAVKLLVTRIVRQSSHGRSSSRGSIQVTNGTYCMSSHWETEN